MMKQMKKGRQDITGCGGVKDLSGQFITDEEKLKIVWEEYFSKRLNEEFMWDKDS